MHVCKAALNSCEQQSVGSMLVQCTHAASPSFVGCRLPGCKAKTVVFLLTSVKATMVSKSMQASRQAYCLMIHETSGRQGIRVSARSRQCYLAACCLFCEGFSQGCCCSQGQCCHCAADSAEHNLQAQRHEMTAIVLLSAQRSAVC